MNEMCVLALPRQLWPSLANVRDEPRWELARRVQQYDELSMASISKDLRKHAA
jgi:hypothetical protein